MIKKFEDFILESRSDQDLLEIARNILKLNIERGTNFSEVKVIPNTWKIYENIVHIDPKDKMKASNCYPNALKFAKKKHVPLIIGVFIHKKNLLIDEEQMKKPGMTTNPYYFLYPHAFNLDNEGNVYDVTLYNDPSNYFYVGREIDPSKYQDGFGDLQPLVRKELNGK
jgi:hypothetical protein